MTRISDMEKTGEGGDDKSYNARVGSQAERAGEYSGFGILVSTAALSYETQQTTKKENMSWQKYEKLLRGYSIQKVRLLWMMAA
jgi:hypothetical protein